MMIEKVGMLIYSWADDNVSLSPNIPTNWCKFILDFCTQIRCLSISYRMKMYTKLISATWLRIVRTSELNIVGFPLLSKDLQKSNNERNNNYLYISGFVICETPNFFIKFNTSENFLSEGYEKLKCMPLQLYFHVQFWDCFHFLWRVRQKSSLTAFRINSRAIIIPRNSNFQAPMNF